MGSQQNLNTITSPVVLEFGFSFRSVCQQLVSPSCETYKNHTLTNVDSKSLTLPMLLFSALRPCKLNIDTKMQILDPHFPYDHAKFKMAAKAKTGHLWDGTVYDNSCFGMTQYACSKFHTLLPQSSQSLQVVRVIRFTIGVFTVHFLIRPIQEHVDWNLSCISARHHSVIKNIRVVLLFGPHFKSECRLLTFKLETGLMLHKSGSETELIIIKLGKERKINAGHYQPKNLLKNLQLIIGLKEINGERREKEGEKCISLRHIPSLPRTGTLLTSWPQLIQPCHNLL